jgi:selenide,water dikinase
MTDVTGFGLLGHAHEMAHLGKVNMRIDLSKLPWLPGAIDYGRARNFPGGMANNLNYFGRWVNFSTGVSQTYQDLLWTPETSGGLFAAVKPDKVSAFRQACPSATIVGEVLPGDGHIEVIASEPGV